MLTYIGLGSNLGDRVANLRRALQALAAAGKNQVVACSSFYLTEPVGKKDQNWFVNAVAAMETSFSPRELINFLMAIEKNFGRERKERWGPRIIDLDLLFYGNLICREEGLQIPHPYIPQRRFVLIPLAEIAPQFRHPLLGKTARELLEEMPSGEEVFRFGEYL